MDSSQDEIGASAILGAQLDEELGGGPVQVKHIVPSVSLFAFCSHKHIFIPSVILLMSLLSAGLLSTVTCCLTYSIFHSSSIRYILRPTS